MYKIIDGKEVSASVRNEIKPHSLENSACYLKNKVKKQVLQ